MRLVSVRANRISVPAVIFGVHTRKVFDRSKRCCFGLSVNVFSGVRGVMVRT